MEKIINNSIRRLSIARYNFTRFRARKLFAHTTLRNRACISVGTGTSSLKLLHSPSTRICVAFSVDTIQVSESLRKLTFFHSYIEYLTLCDTCSIRILSIYFNYFSSLVWLGNSVIETIQLYLRYI